LVAGINTKEGLNAELTAIVEDNLDRTAPHVEYAFDMMKRTGIAVAVTAELPLIAEQAHIELMT
jgi:hypothetical protein